MVGDRKHDIIEAREVGIASIGVLCGLWNARRVFGGGALFLAENIGEPGALLMPERVP